MLKKPISLFLFLFLIFFITPISAMAETDYERLSNIWETDIFDASRWDTQSLQALFAQAGFELSEDQAATIIDLESQEKFDESLVYTMGLLGVESLSAEHIDKLCSIVSGVGGGDEASAYISTAGVVTRMVFNKIILPTAKTRVQKKKEQAIKAMKLPRSIGAAISWDDVDLDDINADLYSAITGMAWDNDNVTLGFMLPYDYVDFDNFDANRIGILGFASYRMEMAETVSAVLTGHLNYHYSDFEISNAENEDVNMYGGGLSASLTLDHDFYVISAAASYMYNTDDTDYEEDEQHLMKFGVNTGIRNGDNGVVNIFAIWNLDITDYDADPDDDDYFEVGFEGTYSPTGAFGLSVGYKKVIELDDFDADQVYIGSMWKF